MRKVKPERWIVLPDIHLLEQDHQTLLAVESYMKDHKWDGWIQLGDLLDFNEISRWTEGKPRLKETNDVYVFSSGLDESLRQYFDLVIIPKGVVRKIKKI